MAAVGRRVVSGDMDLIENAKVTELLGDENALESVIVANKAGETFEVAADHALVFFGLAPKLGPIAEWGLDINRKTINVDTERFETSTSGIYAIVDLNYYPGTKTLISFGFHEAAPADYAIKPHLQAGR